MTGQASTIGGLSIRLAGVWRSQRKELGIIFAIVIMSLALSLTNDRFASEANMFNLLKRISVVGIIALGQTHALISGAMDLSMGSIAGLSGMVCAYSLSQGWPVSVSILFGLLTGLICGSFNGILFGRLRLDPFVVTLGTLTLFKGIIYFWTEGQPIAGLPEAFRFLGQGRLLGLPFQFFVLIASVFVGHALLSGSELGRKIYAIGANHEAAHFAGINVIKTRFSVFVITGLCSAIAGIITASELGTALPESGQAWLLPAFAGAIIGGVSMAGGEGKAAACLIGGTFMAVVTNAMILLDVSHYWQQVGVGTLVVLAVLFDQAYRRFVR